MICKKHEVNEVIFINKSDKQLLWELWEALVCVPKYKNPMDTEAVMTYMKDLEKINKLVSNCIYCLLQKDDGEYEKENYNFALNELKEWIETRKNEQWCGHLKTKTNY